MCKRQCSFEGPNDYTFKSGQPHNYRGHLIYSCIRIRFSSPSLSHAAACLTPERATSHCGSHNDQPPYGNTPFHWSISSSHYALQLFFSQAAPQGGCLGTTPFLVQHRYDPRGVFTRKELNSAERLEPDCNQQGGYRIISD
jgi:hypothetical protein